MPTTQTQIRRDTAANLGAATPAAGELAWDTTNNRLSVGNGSTLGGVKHASAKDVQNQTFEYGTVGGTANAITLTNSPVITAYATGQKFCFKATGTNTTAVTVNVDGVGVKNIYKLSSGALGALAAGDIVSGAVYTIIYDGTQFQISGGVGGGSVVAVKKQIFTGSGTYTPSTGMLYCIAEAIGGGGGGGAGGTTSGGGGGGAGAYSWAVLTAAQIGASKTVTIGAAGTAGGAGGTTSLGSLLNCTGGAAGTAGGTSAVKGGAGGTATLGDLNVTGGSGGTSGEGAVRGSGGDGGASFFGSGGAGGDGSNTASGVGDAGVAYGSGGGGGGGNSKSGGAGAAGLIRITEFCSVV